jgi:hypothetical protein
MWKRASVRPVRESPESSQRLERIEQAVDAIAIEVERISEAQRFQTRLMTEGPDPFKAALAAGQPAAESIELRELQPVSTRSHGK